MKKQTKQLLLLGGVVVICAALYLGLSLWNRQAETDETVYLTQLEDVTSLSFYNGAETLSFSLSDGVWQWDGDSAFPADQSALTSLADAAGQLAAVRIFETPESADSYGLDAPAYEITLSDSAGNQETVLIGNSVDSAYNYFSSCYDYRSDAEEQAACGLDDPVTITVTCSDGSAMKLEIGGATDDGSYYYAVLNGSDAIHHINESIVEDLLSATADSLLAADTETEEAAS